MEKGKESEKDGERKRKRKTCRNEKKEEMIKNWKRKGVEKEEKIDKE